jgi:uncharacterized protein (DUF302 family)
MSVKDQQLGIVVDVPMDYDAAITAVTAALGTEGFGVLTRINVRDTLKEKLDVDFRDYTILGACNPVLAHQALTAASTIGLMLPCNVTVEALEPSGCRVTLADPAAMLTMVENREMEGIATEARSRLVRVAEALATAAESDPSS